LTPKRNPFTRHSGHGSQKKRQRKSLLISEAAGILTGKPRNFEKISHRHEYLHLLY
jgi:hypothetical protein